MKYWVDWISSDKIRIWIMIVSVKFYMYYYLFVSSIFSFSWLCLSHMNYIIKVWAVVRVDEVDSVCIIFILWFWISIFDYMFHCHFKDLLFVIILIASYVLCILVVKVLTWFIVSVRFQFKSFKGHIFI